MPEPLIKDRPKGAIDLLEESVHLLRQAPAGALIAYYTGAIPFWLGLLYFIADMSHSGYARERLASASLGAACLFFWMKCWQAVFASRIRASLLGESPEPWSIGRVVRLLLTQMNIQGWGLVIRPIAMTIVVPSAWVTSFYQNATILGDGARGDGRSTFSRAWRQTKLWPWQTLALSSLLSLFKFFIWLNILISAVAIPQLLKTLFGIETMFSRQPMAMLNTTVFSVIMALAYLCLDPIRKAAWLLRCFYGESLTSGADLRVQIRNLRPIANRSVAAVLVAGALLLGGGGTAAPGRAAEAGPPAASVDASRLDESIGTVLEQREYAWRSPVKEAPREKKAGAMDKWLESVGKTVGKFFAKMRGGIGKALRWIFERDHSSRPHQAGGSIDLPVFRLLMYALIGAAVVLLAWAIWRAWGGPQTRTVTAAAANAAPDLHAEDVTADQLPEDGWLQLTRELMERGELRLALRAAYLASLAHLGQRELLTIARHKSNRDYDRELRRRARSRGELLSAFADNMNAFERVWYGLHEVTADTLAHFQQNLEKIRAC